MANKYQENQSDKTASYLKYAVGEIVLVVLGILIALQINNWNEKKKAIAQEVTILKNIQEDILLDTLDIRFNINYHRKFMADEKKLLDFLRSDRSEPMDTINFANALSVPLIVSLHKSSFENLVNNDVGIMTNNDLKKNISRFYDFFHNGIEKIENDLDPYDTYTTKLPFFLKYFRLENSATNLKTYEFDSREYFQPDLIHENFEMKNATEIKLDEGFKIVLSESIFFTQVKISFYEDMLDRTKELSGEIEDELNKLSD